MYRRLRVKMAIEREGCPASIKVEASDRILVALDQEVQLSVSRFYSLILHERTYGIQPKVGDRQRERTR